MEQSKKYSDTKRPTVGSLAMDLIHKDPETLDPIEIQRAALQDYEKNLGDCIRSGIKDLGNQVDFFVVVETKKERLLKNVIRNYFFYRKTCPTPNYDQSVYHYHYKTDSLEYLWCIPSRDTCFLLREHAPYVEVGHYQLLQHVFDFDNGILLKKAKRLNGERMDSTLLEV